MSKLVQYIKESYDEMVHKVTWSKYSDLQNSSILVLVASLIFALFIGVIDLGFENLLKWYYNNL
ncbi:MAG: preprotein translocase subunit SecE [Cyclobacteriaceae bacterium]